MSARVRYLYLLVALPFLEILILIKLGETIGFWKTVLLVIGVGVVGSLVARLEGMRAWIYFHKALNRGEIPAEHAVDALLIFAAGLLLVFPGFLSDIAGIILLVPWTRFFVKRWLRRRFERYIREQQEGIHYYGDIRDLPP